MQFADEVLPGTWVVKLKQLDDHRGAFVKTYAHSVFAGAGIPAFDFREEFYTVSHKDVVRGMHFQVPPHDHVKMVYCAHGAVTDVLLDLRKGRHFGRVVAVALQADEPQLVLIPKGVAHGFHSLTDHSIMVYKTSTEHAPSHDRGIRWDSLEHDWAVQAPVVSERDRKHPALAEFQSPF